MENCPRNKWSTITGPPTWKITIVTSLVPTPCMPGILGWFGSNKKKDLQVPHKGTWRRFPWGRFICCFGGSLEGMFLKHSWSQCFVHVEKYVAKKGMVQKLQDFWIKTATKRDPRKKYWNLFSSKHSFHDRERAFELRKTVFLISKIDPPGKCIVNFRVKKTRRFFVCDVFFSQPTKQTQNNLQVGPAFASPRHGTTFAAFLSLCCVRPESRIYSTDSARGSNACRNY